MPVYKKKPEKKPKIWVTRTLNQGGQETRIDLDVHTGTHLDAPRHMMAAGKTIDEMDYPWVFDCQVLDLTNVENAITEKTLKKHLIRPRWFVLFKTKNSAYNHFNPEFVYLEKTGAEYVASQKVVGVGIDALGIERNQPNHETHLVLFEKNILILEGLRLGHVKAGQYQLICAPLNIEKSDGAPVRALLVED